MHKFLPHLVGLIPSESINDDDYCYYDAETLEVQRIASAGSLNLSLGQEPETEPGQKVVRGLVGKSVGLIYPAPHIPHRVRVSVSMYANHGVKPGGFLSAVIAGDPCARAMADEHNAKHFDAIVDFVRAAVPAVGRGSREAIYRHCAAMTILEMAARESASL